MPFPHTNDPNNPPPRPPPPPPPPNSTTPPTTPTPPPSLGTHINTTTRPHHTHLNALILSLLPLALPPHTEIGDALLYAQGMRHILPIYSALEAELDRLLAVVDGVSGLKGRGGGEEGVEAVRLVWGSGNGGRLARGRRLREDLEVLMAGRKGKKDPKASEIVKTLPKKARTRDLDIDISITNKTPKLKAFTQRIHTLATTHPSLLLAYMWVLYLALFSGGRYIRARLRGAGLGKFHPNHVVDGVETEKQQLMDSEDNRNRDEDVDADGNANAGLTFWTFTGSEDGEDIKRAFKESFHRAEMLLTTDEKEEVVQEAVYIMECMEGIVCEIRDVVAATTTTTTTASGDEREGAEWLGGNGKGKGAVGLDGKRNGKSMGKGPQMEELSFGWLLLKHILPMGLPELVCGTARGLGLGG